MGLAGALFAGGVVEAANITVLSTRATEEVYRELLPRFEQQSGHRVTTTFSGTSDVLKRIAAGETYDIVIMIDTAIDELVSGGKVAPGSRVDIARTIVGIGIRAGLPKPDVGSAESLKSTLLATKSIAYTTGPSGDVLIAMLRKMGIADAVRPNLKQAVSGTLIGSMIASGEAEIGFQQANELDHFAGVDYLGPLPAAFQEKTARSGGIMVGTKVPDAARQLLNFLSGPAAAPVIRKNGLDPA
jgi:molybdate transport system substrate-binding protein